MPRIGVDVLRWLLAAGNVTLLTCVVMIAGDFFSLKGEDKGLTQRLVPAGSVKVPPPKDPRTANPNLIRELQRTPPPPPKEKPKPKEPLPPQRGPEEGGPLDDTFELLSVIVSEVPEKSTAFLREKAAEQPGIRSTGSSRSRSSARRGSSRSRTAARGKAASGPLLKVLSVDQEYRGYTIDGIYDDPPRIKYSQGVREYFLYKEMPENRFLYDDDGTLGGLKGLTDEEIREQADAMASALTGSSRNRRSSSRAPTGGKRTLSQAKEDIDEERRGSISDGKEDVKNAVKDNAAREANQRNARNNRANNNTKNNPRNNKANPRANNKNNLNNKNNRNNRTNNSNNNRRETPRSEAPRNTSRAGGVNSRATKQNPRNPGRASTGKRQPGPRNEAEKDEMARIQEMTDEEREAYEEEQQRALEEQQERDN